MLFRIATITLALFAPLTSAQTRATDAAYDYDHPELWKDMDGSVCDGMKNSPIAVEDDGCTRYEDYAMNHGDCTFGHMEGVVTNNGVNLVYKDSNPDCTKPHFDIPGIDETYYHHNAHIHLSSEHTIDGRFFSAEMHMVHLNSGGTRAAVVGSMIEATAASTNPVFEQFLDNWRSVRHAVECGDCAVPFGRVSDSTSMHPYKMVEGNSFYHYDGGLTTPPCSEIVWWNLATKPMSISVRQMADLTDIILNTKTIQDGTCKKVTVASKYGSTSRPTQPLYGRNVDKICPTSMDPYYEPNSAKQASESKDEDDDDESSASSFVVGVGATTVAAAIVGQLV